MIDSIQRHQLLIHLASPACKDGRSSPRLHHAMPVRLPASTLQYP
jgi:hypothetical protein